MKIKLLNDGGYEPLRYIDFPVEVEGFRYEGVKNVVGVKSGELLLVGADKNTMFDSVDLAFLVGCECEVIDE